MHTIMDAKRPLRLLARLKPAILASMRESSYEHIYLSPHLDDVVLSCGGAIYTQTRHGEQVLVVSVFAGSPPDDSLTAFARELKERWGASGDPLAVRRREDLAALHILGAAALHLDFLDCVYRQDERTGQAYYPTVEHIFASLHPAETELHHRLLEALLAQLGTLKRATVYAPLGAGHHVDHLLVRRMAQLLLARGHRVLFYEDYPYAGDAQTVGAALEAEPGKRWQVQAFYFDEEAMRAKGDAAACYASQISTFWSSVEEMREALRIQALRVGGGHSYAENYWQLLGSRAQRSIVDPVTDN